MPAGPRIHRRKSHMIPAGAVLEVLEIKANDLVEAKGPGPHVCLQGLPWHRTCRAGRAGPRPRVRQGCLRCPAESQHAQKGRSGGVAQATVRLADRSPDFLRRPVIQVRTDRLWQFVGRPITFHLIVGVHEVLLRLPFCFLFFDSVTDRETVTRRPLPLQVVHGAVKELPGQFLRVASGPLADTYFPARRISDDNPVSPSAHNGPMFMVSIASSRNLLAHGRGPFEGRRLLHQLLSIRSPLVVGAHVDRHRCHTGQSRGAQNRWLVPKLRTPRILDHNCTASSNLKVYNFFYKQQKLLSLTPFCL